MILIIFWRNEHVIKQRTMQVHDPAQFTLLSLENPTNAPSELVKRPSSQMEQRSRRESAIDKNTGCYMSIYCHSYCYKSKLKV